MKCQICKKGETRSGNVTVTLERNGATVIFRNVPADICDTCGEEYINETITDELLKQAEAAVQNGVQVEIRQYPASSYT